MTMQKVSEEEVLPKLNLRTIVAYRADGQDTIRGCLMGQSSSELIIKTTDSTDDLVFMMIDILESEEVNAKDRAYNLFEIYFIDSNGEQHWGYKPWNSTSYRDRKWDNEDMMEIYARARSIHHSNVTAKQAREAAAQEKKSQDEKHRMEESERQKLRELLAKYPEALNGS